MAEWYGVDLDGTLAEYHGWSGGIGKPIPAMVERVRQMLSEGKEVRIVTARVAVCGVRSEESGRYADPPFADEQRKLIEDFCLDLFGQKLKVTAQKDFELIALYDDRAIQVVYNTGELLQDKLALAEEDAYKYRELCA